MTQPTDPWTHDPDHSLLQGDTAMRLLRRLGVLTDPEERRIMGRLMDRYQKAPKAVEA